MHLKGSKKLHLSDGEASVCAEESERKKGINFGTKYFVPEETSWDSEEA